VGGVLGKNTPGVCKLNSCRRDGHFLLFVLPRIDNPAFAVDMIELFVLCRIVCRIGQGEFDTEHALIGLE
jgi:hypothetical protein